MVLISLSKNIELKLKINKKGGNLMSLTKFERDRLVDEFYNRCSNGEISINQRELLITKVNSEMDISSFMESTSKPSMNMEDRKEKLDTIKDRLYSDWKSGKITLEQREDLLLRAKNTILMENNPILENELVYTEATLSKVVELFETCVEKIRTFIFMCLTKIKEFFTKSENKKLEQEIKHTLNTNKAFANTHIELPDIRKIDDYNDRARQELKNAKTVEDCEQVKKKYEDNVKKAVKIGAITLTALAAAKLCFDFGRVNSAYKDIESKSETNLKQYRDTCKTAFDNNAAAYIRKQKTASEFKAERDNIESAYDTVYRLNTTKMKMDMELAVDRVTHHNKFLKKIFNKICSAFWYTPEGRANAQMNKYHKDGWDVAPDKNFTANVHALRESVDVDIEKDSKSPEKAFESLTKLVSDASKELTKSSGSTETKEESVTTEGVFDKFKKSVIPEIKISKAVPADFERFYKNDDYLIEDYAKNETEITDEIKSDLAKKIASVKGFNGSTSVTVYTIRNIDLNKKYKLTDVKNQFKPNSISLVVPMNIFKTKTDWHKTKGILGGRYFSDVIDNKTGEAQKLLSSVKR